MTSVLPLLLNIIAKSIMVVRLTSEVICGIINPYKRESGGAGIPRLKLSMKGKSFKITIIVLISILFMVLLSIVLFAAVNGYSARYMVSKIFPGTVENIYKPYKVLETKTAANAEIAGCGGYVYVLDDKNITSYNDRGVEVYSDILDYEDAVISGGGKRAVVYDRTTGAYIILEDGEKLFDDTIGRTVLGANMQENGYVVFILKGKDGFLGSAMILSDSNDIIGEYNYSDRFPVSGCTLEDAKFAVSGIYSNNTNRTGIDVFEAYNKVPVAGINRDYLMPLIMPIGSNAFITAGTNNAMVFSSDGTEMASLEFNEVIRLATSPDNGFVIDRKTGTDSIICIDRNGVQKWVFASGLVIEGVTSGDRHLFYWAGINAACLDENGKPIDLQSGFDHVVGIADIGNGKVAVVTAGKIVYYEYH